MPAFSPKKFLPLFLAVLLTLTCNPAFSSAAQNKDIISGSGPFTHLFSSRPQGQQEIKALGVFIQEITQSFAKKVYSSASPVVSKVSKTVQDKVHGYATYVASVSFAKKNNVGNTEIVTSAVQTGAEDVLDTDDYQPLFPESKDIDLALAPFPVPSVNSAATIGASEPTSRIVERIIVGDITRKEVDQKIEQLRNKFASDLSQLSFGSGGSITNVYQSIAHTQKIDQLNNTVITSATINSSTISSPTITGATLTSSTFGDAITVTSGTSTFAGLEANALNVTSTTATSTFANGIRLTGGCFELADGTCAGAGGGGGSGDVGSGTIGQIPYYDANGTSVVATSTIFLSTAGNVGIGSTSPYAKLSVAGEVVGSHFTSTSTTATSTFANGLIVSNAGAKSIEVYNTATDSATFEKGVFQWSANSLLIGNHIGTGGQTRSLVLGIDATAGTPFTTNTGRIFSITPTLSSGKGFYDFNWGGTTLTGAAMISARAPLQASSGNQQVLGLYPDINQSGTAGHTTLYVSPYLRAVGSGSGYLIDAGTNTAADNQGTHTTKFNVTSGGYVGISTTTPWAKLSVNSSGETGPAFAVGSSTATNLVVTNAGNVGIGTAAPEARLTSYKDASSYTEANSVLLLKASAGSTQSIRVFTDNTNTRSVIQSIQNGVGAKNLILNPTQATSAGKVGVGTTTPWGILSVGSTIDSVPVLALQADTGQSANVFDVYSSTGSSMFALGPTGNIISASTELSTFAAGLTITQDSTNATKLIRSGTPTQYLELITDSNGNRIKSTVHGGSNKYFTIESDPNSLGIRFRANGNDNVYVDRTGFLGVGTSTPFANLSVTAAQAPDDLNASTTFAVYGGQGGNVASVGGGTGGNIILIGGQGGDFGAAAGSVGGSIFIKGGLSGFGDVGGAGGAVTISGGDGNDGTGASVGGVLTLKSGDSYSAGGVGDPVDGPNLIIASGAGASGGNYGNVILNLAGGKVGIGTSTPSGKLDVYADEGTDGVFVRANGQNGISIKPGTGGTAGWIQGANSEATTVANIGLQAEGGNVGIGTASPVSLLHLYSSTPELTLDNPAVAAYKARLNLNSDGDFVLSGNVASDDAVDDGSFSSWRSIINPATDRFSLNRVGAGLSWSENAELLTVLGAGNVGIGTSSPYAKLSVAGQVVANNFTATSTTATSTFAGGLYASGLSVFDNVQLGNLSFDTNAGFVTWADLPISSSVPAGTVEAYSANLNGVPVLTIYGQATSSGVIHNLAVGIGTTSPLHQLDILAGSTTPETTGKLRNYFGINVVNQATSSTAALVKAGINITSTGSWSGSTASNIGLYVSSVTGGTNNYDAIFNGGGNVGVGTSSPWALLSVNPNGITGPAFAVGSSTGTNFVVANSGYVGIGTTTPAFPLDVFASISSDQTYGFLNSAGGVGTSNGVNSYSIRAQQRILASEFNAVSDVRLKDVQFELNSGIALSAITQLQPVSFTWKTNPTGQPILGFLAQEVEGVIPNAVSILSTDKLEDQRQLDYNQILTVSVGAIKELSSILDIQTSTSTASTTTVSLRLQNIESRLNNLEASSSASSFFGNVTEWVGEKVTTTYGYIKNVFADKVTTKELCVDDVCVTRDELQAILLNAGINKTNTSTTTSSGNIGGDTATSTAPTATDTEAPVITLIGNNPATINKGDSYIDPGATVTDNVNDNLGVTITGDQFDTSVAGTYTVTYSATDQAGNQATTTRAVIVADPNPSPVVPETEPEPETEPTENTETASSTPETGN